MRRLASSILIAAVFLVIGTTTAASGTKLRGEGLIAFSMTGANYYSDVYVIRPDGTRLRRLTNTPSVTEELPSWSPDGRRIAFGRHGLLGTPGYIYTMNANGSGVRRLFAVPKGDWAYPAWSANGRWIGFTEYGQPGIYLVGTDGRHFHKIPGTMQAGYPSWSPDSKRLVFSSEEGIFTIGVDGSGRRQLSAGGQGPAWSHHGRLIAFTLTTSAPGSDIWVMRSDGSGARQLTHVPDTGINVTNASNPTWSPDDKRIAFTMGSGNERLYVMNADGSDQHRVGRARRPEYPAWQP